MADNEETGGKLSPGAQKALETIQRCVAAVPRKPIPTSLKDFTGSVMMMPSGVAKDPKETALRRKLKALDRKYEAVWERARLNGIFSATNRLKLLGQQIDEAQKALDEYLAKRSA